MWHSRWRFGVLSLVLIFSLGCGDDSATPEPSPPGPISSATKTQAPSEPQPVPSGSGSTTVETPSPSDREQLEGSWKVVAIELQGRSQPIVPGMPDAIEVTDGVFTALSAEREIGPFAQLSMIINSASSPKELDLARKSNVTDRLESLPCIYSLSGDSWKIAMPMLPAGKAPSDPLPRPESLDSSTGPFMVMIAERADH